MSSPAPVAIESTIRDIISELYRTDKLEQLTVKRVRIAAEQELSLDPGWFKTHEVWKDRSKKFIEEEAVCATTPMLWERKDDVNTAFSIGTTSARG
jgi:hypothetical protein